MFAFLLHIDPWGAGLGAHTNFILGLGGLPAPAHPQKCPVDSGDPAVW